MKTSLYGLMTSLALVALPAQALADGVGAELTGARAQGQWGGEIGVGYGANVGPVVIRPVAGAFVYSGDTTSARFYGKVEAALTIPAIAEIGIGARYMREKLLPYGLIALPIAPKLKVAAQVGDRYVSAGIRFGF